eukprot:TRINITY_DN6562_c0_g1_i1.p1 TRINITY_DN6562_c0_g1~~TRINITY_DN6562_c0_g1_i1.p1  ORF type:complete len:547 (+),score=77.91 TRINITY_DN6562_c0_g1_i1:31-1671(+)
MELREFITKFGSININNDEERYWRIIVNCFLVDGLEQVLLEALPVLFKHYYGRFATFNNGELSALLQESEFKAICRTKIIQSAVWIQPSDFLQRVINNSFDLKEPTHPVSTANNDDDDYISNKNNPFIQLAQKEKEEQHYEARFGKLTLEEFSCGICFELLKEAVEGNCCKNLFCMPCIEQYGRKCPNCRRVVEWTANEPIRRLINKKPIKCDYDDCNIWSTVGEIDHHRINCEFNPQNKLISAKEDEIELRKTYERLRLEHLTKYAGVVLYIKNLEDALTEGHVWIGFNSFYGNMRAVRVMTDNRGVNTGFIWFTTPDATRRAFERMNGRVLPGFTRPLQLYLRVPNAQRRRKWMRQHTARTTGRVPNMPEELYLSFGRDSDHAPRDNVPRRVQSVNRRQSRRTYKRDIVPDSSSVSTHRSRASDYNNSRDNYRESHSDRPSVDNTGPSRQHGKAVTHEERSITIEELNEFSPEQQRHLLGDLLYARVTKHLKSLNENIQLAGKITGMILDSDDSDGLVDLLSDAVTLAQLTQDGLNLLKQEQYE